MTDLNPNLPDDEAILTEDNLSLKSQRPILRGKALEEYKKTLQLSEEQKDIIIGTLLGDSTMGLRRGGPVYAMKFEQSTVRRQYLLHLAKVFANFCGQSPIERWLDKAKTRAAIGFRTYRHDSLIFYFNLFYDLVVDPDTGKTKSVKKVPKNIAKFLTPRAVAYWFMDDGTSWTTQGYKYYVFNTQGFTKPDCQILCDALKSNFNIESYLVKDRHMFRVSIAAQSKQDFLNLITSYIQPDCKYKL